MESTEQANFRLSSTVLKELRQVVPRGAQSEFVEAAIKKELKSRLFREAIEKTFGAWGPRKDLGSTQKFIRGLRQGRRFKRSR